MSLTSGQALTAALIVVLMCVVIASAQPWQPEVIWDRSGEGDSSQFGYRVLPLGDQNDDGFADFAVWAEGGSGDPARLEFYHGGNPPSLTPYRVRLAETPSEVRLGWAQTLGDLNGDGYVDWSVWVRLPNNPEVNYCEKLYAGGPEGGTDPFWVVPTPPFCGVEGVGDFNGDGVDDLLYTDSWTDTSDVYFGGSPFDTLPDWQRSEYIPFRSRADVNGDGIDDIVMGNNRPPPGGPSRIHVYLGSAAPDTVPFYTWYGWGDNPWPLGDVNGDHADDIVAIWDSQFWLQWGGSEISTAFDWSLSLTQVCYGIAGGSMLVSAGDVNGDGYDDFLTVFLTCLENQFGAAGLFLGAPQPDSLPVWRAEGWTEPWNLIGLRSAAGLGDVNGDGVDDWALGVTTDNAYLGVRGRVVIFAGDTAVQVGADAPRPVIPQELRLSAYPNPFNSRCTVTLEVPRHAGRVELAIYNLTGQEVSRTTIDAQIGRTDYALDADRLPSGVYILRATMLNLTQAMKLVVLK